MKRNMFAVCMIVVLTLCFVVGCSGPEAVEAEKNTEEVAENTDTQQTEEAPDADEDETLRMATFWMPGNADPAVKWNGWVLARFGVGEGLVQFDENLGMKNVIAESWRQVDDLTLEFIIRDNVVFSNGKKVDAAACKASIERAITNTERKDIAIPVDEIIADGQTLTIKTSKPSPIMVNLLADPFYCIIDVEAEENDPDFVFHPIATGPFVITEFVPDEKIDLVKNEHYWNGDIDVEKVKVQLYADKTARAMALQAGEVDFTHNINPTDIQLFENDDYTIHKGPNLRIQMLVLNTERPFLKDLDFRKALSYATDKKTYAEDLQGYHYSVGPYSKNLPFAYQGEEKYGYNPEKAKELLDGLGYADTNGDGIREKDGKDVTIDFTLKNSDANENTLAIAMQAQLREVGIMMTISQHENLSEVQKSGNFDIFATAWVSAPTLDPQHLLKGLFYSGSDSNHCRFKNDEFDAVIEALDTTYTKEDRNALGIKGTEILMEELPALFIGHKDGIVITKSNVGGVYRFMTDIHHIDARVTID